MTNDGDCERDTTCELAVLRISVRRYLCDGHERVIGNSFDPNRHSSQFDMARVAFAPDFGNSFVGNSRRGNQHLLDLLFTDDFGEQSVPAKNPKSMNEFSMLVRIVIHETDWSIAKLTIVE